MIKYTTPLLITTSLVLAGCAKKPPEQLPPAPVGTAAPTPAPSAGPGYAPGSQGDFLANTMSDRVLFDTDRFNIDSQDQAILQSQARGLAQNPNARITIEGHADEPCTRAYNLALGARRAASLQNYLGIRGLPDARVKTITYCKGLPLELSPDDASLSRMRRTAILLSGWVRPCTSGRTRQRGRTHYVF